MQFRRPSPIDRLFETPAQERPLLDLGIVSSLALPEDCQNINSGVTRWADVMLGFSLDHASRRGYEPSAVNVAFEVGELSLQAFFFKKDRVATSTNPNRPQYGYDNEAWLVGSLVSRTTTLSISGGEPLSPPFSVQYRRGAGSYHPTRSGYAVAQVDADRPYAYAVDISEVYASVPDDPSFQPKDAPPELRAAQALGYYADQVEEAFDAGQLAVRCDIASTRFDGLQGRG